MSRALNKKIEQLQKQLENLKSRANAGSSAFFVSAENPKNNVRTQILSKESNFEVWKSIVVNELRGQGYEYIIDHTKQKPNDIDEEETERRRSLVYSYLLNRLSADYQRIVCQIGDPSKIMERLEQMRRPKLISAFFAVRRKWNILVFQKGRETMDEFIIRFDELVKQYETYEQMAEKEKRRNFAMAVEKGFRDIVRQYDDNSDEVTVDDLKVWALNEEAREKELQDREGKENTEDKNDGELHFSDRKNLKRKRDGSRSEGEKHSKKRNIDCRRCGKLGHGSWECKSRAWICYNCQQSTTNPDHYAETCWSNRSETRQRGRGGFRGRGTTRGRGGRGRNGPRGRGGFRGTPKFGSDDRSKYQWRKTEKERGRKDGRSPLKRDTEAYAVEKKTLAESEANMMAGNEEKIVFIADCAATEHVSNNPEYYNSSEKVTNKRMRSANKNSDADLIIERKGEIHVRGRKNNIIKLKNVLCSRRASRNLFSLRKIVNRGASILLNNTSIKILDKKNKVVKVGKFDGRFWWLEYDLVEPRKKSDRTTSEMVLCNEVVGSDHAYSKNESERGDHSYAKDELKELTFKDIRSSDDLRKYVNTVSEMKVHDLLQLDEERVKSLRDNIPLLWHYRLNHISKEGLQEAAKTIKELKGVTFGNEIVDCETCKMGKIKRRPSNTKRERRIDALALVHTDLMGPIEPTTFKFGNKYIVTFIDDYTRYAWTYAIYDKTQVHLALELMLRDARTKLGPDAKIREMRLDRGTEYWTADMRRVVEKENITYEICPPATPNLNGTAERFNLELGQKIRCLIFNSGFPLCMWGFALQFVVNVYNKTPHKSVGNEIPYEIFCKRPATIKYVRRFGSLCYVLKTGIQGKFKERGIQGFLVGCDSNQYRVIEPESGKVYKSKNVEFIESKTYGYMYGKKEKRTGITDPVITEEGKEWWYREEKDSTRESESLFDVRDSFVSMCSEQFRDDDEDENKDSEIYALQEIDAIERESEPKTFEEAELSEQRDQWSNARK